MKTTSYERPFGSSAFEPESEVIKLLYNRSSGCLVAQLRRPAGEHVAIDELYHRRSADVDYCKVLVPAARSSCWDPVSCRSRPFVFFNTVQWDPNWTGTEWISISRLSLPNGEVTSVVDSTLLQRPSGCIRAWVASILDVDDEGAIITCRLGLEYESATRAHSSSVEYSVSEVDVASGKSKVLAILPNVFV